MLNWLFPRTVADIIKRFVTVVEDLEQHAADKIAERERHFLQSDIYKKYADEAHAEWAKASAIAANIKKLLES